jgi:hypothetical protein
MTGANVEGWRFYNGATLEDIHGSGFEKGCVTKDGETNLLGIQGWFRLPPFLTSGLEIVVGQE